MSFSPLERAASASIEAHGAACARERPHASARPSSKAAVARGSPSLTRAAPRSRLRLDNSFEAHRVLVSSEAGGGHGETEDLGDLARHGSRREGGFEGAQAVLLGEGVIPPVHGAVGEEVIVMELLCQRLRALELRGCHEQWQTPASELSTRAWFTRLRACSRSCWNSSGFVCSIHRPVERIEVVLAATDQPAEPGRVAIRLRAESSRSSSVHCPSGLEPGSWGSNMTGAWTWFRTATQISSSIVGLVRALAFVLIACFSVALGRAWQLMQNTTVGTDEAPTARTS